MGTNTELVAESSYANARGRTHVLVVDDDKSTLRVLGLRLADAGFSVVTATNGAAALKEIEERVPDIVLTDWEMPEVNGLSLCREIRKQDYDAYVYLILMTAHTEQMSASWCIAAGADEFFCKPVPANSLIARLDAITRFLNASKELVNRARGTSADAPKSECSPCSVE